MTAITNLVNASDLLGELREVARTALAELLSHAWQSQNLGQELPTSLDEITLKISTRLVGTMSQAIASAMMRKLHTVEARLCGFCGSPIEEETEEAARAGKHRACIDSAERKLAVSALEMIGRSLQTAFVERCTLLAASSVKPADEIDTLIACYEAMPGGEGSAFHAVFDDSNWSDENISAAIGVAERGRDVQGIALGKLLYSLTMEQRMSLAVVCDCGCTPERSSKKSKLEWERTWSQALSALPSRRHTT